MGDMVRNSTDFVVLDLPAFEVTITNNTGHIIRFSKAVIKLQDDAGEMTDQKMKSDLEAGVGTAYQNWKQQNMLIEDLNPVYQKIKALKVLDRNTELLPNMTEKAYISFVLPFNTMKEYESFLSSKQYLKIMLYEIPVEMNEAGETQKTTNFEFIFDVVAETIQPVEAE